MTEDPRSSREFQAYLRAREAVLRMKAGNREGGPEGPPYTDPPDIDPSAYWAEELENIDYMIEASPLIVRKLRHHAFHITGIRPYDYRSKEDGRREHFESRLQALRELGGDALLVSESPALGGFGYDIGGRLFNVDTIKFYEVLIGMDSGGVLPAVRSVDRPVACEIGAGWGGFAYQFKTLFPNATYFIIDFPELFLFSATYLGVLFRDARVLFAGTENTRGIDGWRDADFVFVPHTHADVVRSVPLDLTINMVSFQEMTDEQVRGYADLAADAGCPLLYSLNRERSPYNRQLVSVSEALADRYRLTEVPVLGTDYTSAMKKAPKASRTAERSELSYRHLVGRLEPSTVRPPRHRNAPVEQRLPHGRSDGPRVVLGMTLYNNAPYLREALDSLLGQTFTDFRLLMLDDASSDETEAVAREYEARDSRVQYERHASRQAMIATWREVAETALREFPNAPYFAWVSDHDRWHPRWLEQVVAALDADPGLVLAYPITRRLTQDGVEREKGLRRFDTADCVDLQDRWRRFCLEGVGAGDMVYGLMRRDALTRAGVFRTVLRPDRLLIAELTLQGRLCQIPEVLWYRRGSSGTSVERQRHTLVLQGREPKGFFLPPWLQHTRVLWREYAEATPPPLPISRGQWRRMLMRYQLTYGWRHFRKSDTSHAINRGINGMVWARKMSKHHFHHAVYNTLVGLRTFRGKARRAGRRAVYEVLMFTHKTGLRGRGETHTR